MNEPSSGIVYCYISGEPIPPARVEALREMGIPERFMTVIKHSQTRRPQAIYLGEHGTSELKIVRKVDADSNVRKVFTRDDEAEDEEDEKES